MGWAGSRPSGPWPPGEAGGGDLVTWLCRSYVSRGTGELGLEAGQLVTPAPCIPCFLDHLLLHFIPPAPPGRAVSAPGLPLVPGQGGREDWPGTCCLPGGHSQVGTLGLHTLPHSSTDGSLPAVPAWSLRAGQRVLGELNGAGGQELFV